MSIIQSTGPNQFTVSISLRDEEGTTRGFGFTATSRAEACEKLGQWMNDHFDSRLRPMVEELEGLHVCPSGLAPVHCPSCP